MKTIFLKIIVIGMLMVTGGLMVANPAMASNVDCVENTLSLKNGANCSVAGNKKELFGDDNSLFKKITNTLLFLIGAVSVIMIIYAGIQYATSGGDSGKVTSAKNTILYAVVGIIVAVLAYAIVSFVVDNLATK